MNNISIFFYSFPFYLLKRCQLLTGTDLSCDGFMTLPPLMLTLFKTMDVNLSTHVLEILLFGFVSGKNNFDCIEVSIHTAQRQQTS